MPAAFRLVKIVLEGDLNMVYCCSFKFELKPLLPVGFVAIEGGVVSGFGNRWGSEPSAATNVTLEKAQAPK